MTELQKLKAELENIKTRIEELEEKEQKQGGRWKPEIGEDYWSVCSDGEIVHNVYTEYNSDNETYSIGNCFPTKEAAEFEAERLKVLAEMREFAFEPDWGNDDEEKYMIYYIQTNNEVGIDCWNIRNYGDIVFGSLDDARDCIKAIGEERLKKYYFRVEG